jgi:predicted dehydrogenase
MTAGGRPSRRNFLRGSTAAVVGAAMVSYAVPAVHAGGSDELKVGLIGCGGRGSGAAVNALNGDQYAKLVAMGDMFPDKLEASLKNLKSSDVGNRINVADDHKFTGWDAYKGVIDKCDVVLLTTPPFFRPMHLKAAIEAGKHVFCEKPVATDAPGVRSVMETAKLAREKGLNLVSGLCYRYDAPKIEIIKKIRDGAVGRIVSMQTNYLTGGLWSNPRKPEWSDMEWQLRNWLYFTWLSGDHITEQHIHSLDKIMWTMGDEPPVQAFSSGGRTVRTGPEFGNVYDHFNTTYEWANGVKLFSGCRQYPAPPNLVFRDVTDHIFGTEGTAHIQAHQTTDPDGKVTWKHKDAPISMYDAEHVALFNAIRSGKPINNGDYMCKSTLMAIMGRMSAYTGRAVAWEEALNSVENLSPEKLEFGPIPAPVIAVPGTTLFS